MFNALRSDELLVGIGEVLRMVAGAPGALEQYERSQLLSAYSVTRLLAAEQAAAAELLADTKRSLGVTLAGDPRPEIVQGAQRIEAATGGVEVGDALVTVLASLDRRDPLRGRVHAVLAEMMDREVAALAMARR